MGTKHRGFSGCDGGGAGWSDVAVLVMRASSGCVRR